MPARLPGLVATLAVVLLLFAARETRAQSAAETYFTNTELSDQDGNTLRFYQDVLKGKVVVISSFYSTCVSACPPTNRNLQKLQDTFAKNLGKDLFLISITVDPVTDTPEKLKAYAQKYGGKPGRLFLTGRKGNVEVVLKKLGQFAENKEAHPKVILVGNDRTGLWKKTQPYYTPEDLTKIIESVIANKN